MRANWTLCVYVSLSLSLFCSLSMPPAKKKNIAGCKPIFSNININKNLKEWMKERKKYVDKRKKYITGNKKIKGDIIKKLSKWCANRILN